MPVLIFLLVLCILGLLLYIRYLRSRYILPNRSTGSIQQLSQKKPKIDTTTPFLPGSKVGRKEILKDLEVNINRTKKLKKNRLFASKEDIKRSYIIDAILDKPKFKE